MRPMRVALTLTVAMGALVTAPPASADAVFSGSITMSDPVQADVLAPDGHPSACVGFDGPYSPFSGSAHFDVYYIRNNASESRCVTVTTTTLCNGPNAIMVASYFPFFNRERPGQNWYGDVGFTPNPTQSYSFALNPNSRAEIVVSETVPDLGCPSYTVLVVGADVATAPPPPPPPPPPSPPPPPPQDDVDPPSVKALPSSGRRGKKARLRYRAIDESETQEVISIYSGKRLIDRRRTRLGPSYRSYYVRWPVPVTAPSRLRFCVRSSDSWGNRSKRSCARLTVYG